MKSSDEKIIKLLNKKGLAESSLQKTKTIERQFHSLQRKQKLKNIGISIKSYIFKSCSNFKKIIDKPFIRSSGTEPSFKESKKPEIKRSASEWFSHGNKLNDEGNCEGAIKAYKYALNINSNLPSVWYNLGCTYAKIGNDIEAVKSYQEAVKRHSDYLEAWHNLGSALDRLGRTKEAELAFHTEFLIWKKHAQKEGRY